MSCLRIVWHQHPRSLDILQPQSALVLLKSPVTRPWLPAMSLAFTTNQRQRRGLAAPKQVRALQPRQLHQSLSQLSPTPHSTSLPLSSLALSRLVLLPSPLPQVPPLSWSLALSCLSRGQVLVADPFTPPESPRHTQPTLHQCQWWLAQARFPSLKHPRPYLLVPLAQDCQLSLSPRQAVLSQHRQRHTVVLLLP